VRKALSQILGINLSKITITKGQKGRNKIFLIKGITESEFFKKIPLFN
jgi:uncharacterized protein YggU (UPF0235/DUF167 family)